MTDEKHKELVQDMIQDYSGRFGLQGPINVNSFYEQRRFELAKDILLVAITAARGLPISDDLESKAVRNSVSLADALLAELEKEKK